MIHVTLISEKLTLTKPFSTFNVNVIYFSVKVFYVQAYRCVGSLNVHVHIPVKLKVTCAMLLWYVDK